MGKKHKVCTLSEHPDLQDIFKNLSEKADQIVARKKWFDDSFKKFLTEGDELRKKHWGEVEAWAKERGLLPDDYSQEKYYLERSEDLDCLIAGIKEKDEHPMAAMLRELTEE